MSRITPKAHFLKTSSLEELNISRAHLIPPGTMNKEVPFKKLRGKAPVLAENSCENLLTETGNSDYEQ
jgi:hypothetical protein